MEHYLAIKRRKVLVNVTAPISLEIIFYIISHKGYIFYDFTYIKYPK